MKIKVTELLKPYEALIQEEADLFVYFYNEDLALKLAQEALDAIDAQGAPDEVIDELNELVSCNWCDFPTQAQIVLETITRQAPDLIECFEDCLDFCQNRFFTHLVIKDIWLIDEITAKKSGLGCTLALCGLLFWIEGDLERHTGN